MESSDRHVFESHEALRAGIDKENSRRERDAAIHGVAGGVWALLACIVFASAVIYLSWLNVALFLGYGLLLYVLEKNIIVTELDLPWRYSYIAKDGSTVLEEMYFFGSKRKHRGRIHGLTILQFVVAAGLIFAMSCIQTNFSGNNVVYSRDTKDFAAVGVVDWLPKSQYTILDMDLECANSFRARLDIDDDKLIEYEAYGYLKASISEEAWKHYVAGEIDGGDGRIKFVFCDIVSDELFVNFGQPFKREGKREVSADEVNAGAAKFFEERGLNADIKIDVVSIEHFVKN